jgi:hypothetical protein
LSLIAILLLLTTGLTIAVVGTAPLAVSKGPPELVTLKQAAEAGDSESQYELGILYEHGTGVSDHLVQAYCWYVRAAAQGNERAARQRDALMKQLSPADIESCQTSAGTTRVAARDNLGIASDFAAPIRLAQDPQLPPPSSPTPTPMVATYQDALIDPSISEDPVYSAGRADKVSDLLPGSASVEYRYYNQSTSGITSGGYTEHGVAAEARQETRNYGRFEARGIFTDANADGAFYNSFTGGGYANLTQRGFALTDRWLMNNELGHLRARVPDILSQGYRIRLTEPLVQGAFSESRSDTTTIRLGGGTLGTWQGRTFPVFSTDASSGTAAGMSASTRITPSWEAAGQIWHSSNVLTDTAGTTSFTSAAGAMRYDGRDQGKAQVTVLGNSGGDLGFWMDGEKRLWGWINNVGLYRMDPNLKWIDRQNAVITDTQGVYWRGNTRSYRTNYAFGADWAQTNIDKDAARPTRDNLYGYGNIYYRATPTLNLSGFLSLGQENVSGAGIDTSDNTVNVRGSLSEAILRGTSTWSLGMVDRSGSNPFTRYEGNWDHNWNPFAAFNSLRAGVAYVQQTSSTSDYSEVQLRGGGAWSQDGFRVGANAYLGFLSGEIVDSNRSASATLSLGWQIGRGWQVGADLTYNHNATQVTNGVESRVSDLIVLASLRYDASWGQSQRVLGVASSAYGSGTIRGVLYYDKNGNGVRDADEAGVPNITIYLDRNTTVETNANGEFSFTPVPSGEHELTVNVANIPLPWVIDENRRITATVRPRDSATVEIPLLRIGPN